MASTIDFYIVQHDTGPVLSRTLQQSDGTAAVLTGATVRFNMRTRGGTTAVVSRASTTITDAANGIVAYHWSTGDTATAGDYEGEFEVTFADGTVQTFPNPAKMLIRITGDIA